MTDSPWIDRSGGRNIFERRPGTATGATAIPRDAVATPSEAVLSLGEALEARLTTALRDGWWRRGGELLSDALEPVRPAPLPAPVQITAARDALVQSGRSGIRRWRYHPVDFGPVLSACGRAERLLETSDHPLADEARAYVAGIVASWRRAGLLVEGRSPRGGDALADEWAQAWATPTPAELDEAIAVLTRVVAEQDDTRVRREEVLDTLATALAETAPGWLLQERPGLAAAASTSRATRTVSVDPAQITSAAALRRLVVHEVHGHVARSVAASAHRDVLAEVALGADAAETEEGVALALEHQHGVASPQQRRRYAARLLAVHLAAKNGLSAVYRALCDYVPEVDAAAIAVRVKRGIPEPEGPGAFTRDVIYLRGAAKVELMLRTKPSLMPALRSTKWGVDVIGRQGHLLRTGVDR